MANQKNFAVTPSVSITRSKFLRNSQHKTTMKMGEITPIFLDEVLPGDTRKIDMAALVRMATPVAPIMDNIHVDYYAFFVPNRLVWNHWKEFMGENTSGAGIFSGTAYTIPTSQISGVGSISVGQLGDHLGLPVALNGTTSRVSSLPGRAYMLIYNEWFRDQNLIAPVTIAVDDNTAFAYNQALKKAAKDSDYFTRCLPYVQKGNPVTIPLGVEAPLIGKATLVPISATSSVMPVTAAPVGATTGLAVNGSAGSPAVADLRNATSATINDLRFAFQYQKMLEKDALYGTRYWEILKGHFGVDAPDASLQRPELLGHWRQAINIDQVIQTTGLDASSPSSNELGNTAAVSVTGGKGNICTKSFTEHGHIMVLAVARHDQTYGQGEEKLWIRSKRTDFYFPEFANLGAQPVLNREIYAEGHITNDDHVFGYQEAWAEYRYKPSQVTGLLRPNVPGLGYWTLANNFAALPTLSASFIEQDSSNISRAIGSLGFDFICDFAFRDVAVRPMPLYSVPGLIDHH